jgi:hypothetical protein
MLTVVSYPMSFSPSEEKDRKIELFTVKEVGQMKNNYVLPLAASILLITAAMNYIQDAEGRTTKKTEVKTFTGKIDSVSLADPAKGTKSEITVIDRSNKKISFIVTSTTTIYGARSAPATLNNMKKDDKVKIKYITTKEGIDEAISLVTVP